MGKLFIKTGAGLVVFFAAWIFAYTEKKDLFPLWAFLLIFFAGIATIVIAFAMSYKRILNAEAHTQQRWNQRQ